MINSNVCKGLQSYKFSLINQKVEGLAVFVLLQCTVIERESEDIIQEFMGLTPRFKIAVENFLGNYQIAHY